MSFISSLLGSTSAGGTVGSDFGTATYHVCYYGHGADVGTRQALRHRSAAP